MCFDFQTNLEIKIQKNAKNTANLQKKRKNGRFVWKQKTLLMLKIL